MGGRVIARHAGIIVVGVVHSQRRVIAAVDHGGHGGIRHPCPAVGQGHICQRLIRAIGHGLRGRNGHGGRFGLCDLEGRHQGHAVTVRPLVVGGVLERQHNGVFAHSRAALVQRNFVNPALRHIRGQLSARVGLVRDFRDVNHRLDHRYRHGNIVDGIIIILILGLKVCLEGVTVNVADARGAVVHPRPAARRVARRVFQPHIGKRLAVGRRGRGRVRGGVGLFNRHGHAGADGIVILRVIGREIHPEGIIPDVADRCCFRIILPRPAARHVAIGVRQRQLRKRLAVDRRQAGRGDDEGVGPFNRHGYVYAVDAVVIRRILGREICLEGVVLGLADRLFAIHPRPAAQGVALRIFTIQRHIGQLLAVGRRQAGGRVRGGIGLGDVDLYDLSDYRIGVRFVRLRVRLHIGDAHDGPRRHSIRPIAPGRSVLARTVVYGSPYLAFRGNAVGGCVIGPGPARKGRRRGGVVGRNDQLLIARRIGRVRFLKTHIVGSVHESRNVAACYGRPFPGIRLFILHFGCNAGDLSVIVVCVRAPHRDGCRWRIRGRFCRRRGQCDLSSVSSRGPGDRDLRVAVAGHSDSVDGADRVIFREIISAICRIGYGCHSAASIATFKISLFGCAPAGCRIPSSCQINI